MKKILIALAFVLCMVVPSAMYANAADDTEEEVTLTDGDTKTVDGAVYQYFADVQSQRTEDNKTTKTDYNSETGATSQGTYYSAPTSPKENYIFAGWYKNTDDAPDTETALKGNFTDTTAWAKFVPSSILGVKAQVKLATNFTSSSTADIRLVTSVDTLKYKRVGFDFILFDEEDVRLGRQTREVYQSLYAVSTDGKVLNYTPEYVFNTMSKYFMGYTFYDVSYEDFGHGVVVKPYWITLDGTLVYGVGDTKTVNQSYMSAVESLTAESVGTISHPAATSTYWSTPTSWSREWISSQGGCTDGEFYYQAVINRAASVSVNLSGLFTDEDSVEYDESKNEVRIQRYKLTDSGWEYDTQSNAYALYHANDITYNSDLDVLVICYNAGKTEGICFMDPDDLTIVSPASLGFTTTENVITVYDNYIALASDAYSSSIYSIDYNALEDKYVVGLSGATKYAILSAKFEYVNSFKQTHDTTVYTHQGVSSDDGHIYFVLYAKESNGGSNHLIYVYDWSGKHVTTITIPTDSIKIGTEPENISVYNNKIYISCGNADDTTIYEVTGMTFSQNYAAYIGDEEDGEFYFSLETALMNADKGDTITLMKDVTVTSSMPILVDDVTITNEAGSEITITRGKSAAMFDNRANGFVIVENSTDNGSLVIDGNGTSVTGSSALILNTASAKMTLDGITVSNVKASGYGAVQNSGTLDVTGCTFSENNAGVAGAIRSEGGIVNIKDSMFDDNNATSGNGGAIGGAAEFTIVNSTFQNNDAAQNGGAIHNGTAATTTIRGCTFDTNTAGDADPRGGGAIFSQGTLTIESYTPEGEEAVKTVFNKNTGEYRGGAIRYEGSSLTISDAQFTENNAGKYGGAIYTIGDIDVKNTEFSNNTATNYGGGIFTTATATVSNTDFEKNSANYGGAIAKAGFNGTAIANSTTTLTVTNGKFNQNSATSNDGGAIYHKATKALSITSADFTSNSAARGGAVYVDGGGATTISGGTYTGNSATTAGGAFNQGTGAANVSGVTMTGNSVGASYDQGGGGAILLGGGTNLTLTNSTVNNNTSTYDASQDCDKVASDVAFRNNGSGSPKLILSDNSFDGVVSWRTTADKGYFGLVQFTAEYTGEGITLCKPTTFESGQNLVQFSGTWTDDAKVATLDKITVTDNKGDYGTGYYHVYDVVEVTNAETGATTPFGELQIAEASIAATDATSYYKYLSGAVEAADGTNAVNVLRDITVKSTIEIGKTVEITNDATTSSVTITRDSGLATTAMFNIAAGGSLDVDGTIVLDGNSVSASKSLVVNEGTLTLGADTVVKNAICSTYGGALLNNSSTATAYIYGTFEDNVANASGGAIRNVSGTLRVEGAKFNNNDTQTSGDGGAISNSQGDLQIRNTVFSYCDAASNGGAIHSNGNYTTEIYGCTFSENSANRGGAAQIESNMTVSSYTTEDGEIIKTTFKGNHSKEYGGAIRYNGSGKSLTITDVVFTENFPGTTGGAIYIDQGTLTLLSTTEDYADSKFEGNYTSGSNQKGGAIYLNKGTLNVGYDGTTTGYGYAFKGNHSTDQGGACYLGTSVTAAYIYNSEFNDNYNTNASGGAILNNTTLTIVNTDFNGNKATSTGGAINQNKNTTLTATDCSFDGNEAKGGNGGAISVTSGSTAYITVSDGNTEKFENNTAAQRGGAIHANNSTVTISGYQFNKNSAPIGGAVNVGNGSAVTVTISNSTFDENEGKGGYTNTSDASGDINGAIRVYSSGILNLNSGCTFGTITADTAYDIYKQGGTVNNNGSITYTSNETTE